MLDTIKYLVFSRSSEKVNFINVYLKENYGDDEIINAGNGLDAKNYLRKNPFSIVFVDDNLPKINGKDLSREFSNIKNNIRYFILLTDDESNENVRGIIDAEADDYIVGEVRENVLYNKLRIANRFISNKRDLVNENEALATLTSELEKDVDNMIELSAKFLQARMPSSYEMLRNISKKSLWIAENFPDLTRQEIREIEIAAYFCQAGRIFLPDSLLKIPVMSNGVPRDKLMYQVPVAAREIVSSIDRFKGVSELLYHIYENMDGTGIPDQKQNWQIPVGSRIIRVVLDYEENKYLNKLQPKSILEKLKSRVNRLYDGRAINLLEQYVLTYESKIDHSDEEAILLAELKGGMVLSRDLVTNSGMKLIGAGTRLTDKSVDLILNHSTTDPILGYIYIRSMAN